MDNIKDLKREDIKNFEDFLNKTTNLVDPKIKEILALYVDKKTQKLLNYQIEVGGKRLRPALALASCLTCGGKIDDVLYPAAGLEILHNYTLIIDDIIDNSNLRRNKPTTWSKFGTSIAQCIGVDYSAAVFQVANRSKNPVRISELFAKIMKTITDGQILDILFEQSGREDEKYVVDNRYKEITQQNYLKMISKKTAVLFETSCQLGGISAEAKESEIESLKNYGFNLGMAFQIQDDILDIFGSTKEFGKEIGHDIKGRKVSNIVILYALKELTSREKKEILDIFKKKEIIDEDVKKVIKLISNTKAKEKGYLLGEKYVQKAKQNLVRLPKNKWNNMLQNIADFVIKRNK
jgi:geranylgeranyl diphosphate synthase type I